MRQEKKIAFSLYLFSLFPSIFPTIFNAQNLVPNPGFEYLTSCPEGPAMDSSVINLAKPWFATGKSTPDLFHTCNPIITKTFSPPASENRRKPHSGRGFAGILMYYEQMQVQLKIPLKASSRYKVSVFVNSVSDIGMSESANASFISFLFSQKPCTQFDFKKQIAHSGKLKRNGDSLLYSAKGWRELSANYIAKGGEKFLIIGGLVDTFNLTKPEVFQAAYLFIDDVSVTPIAVSAMADSNPFINKLEPGKTLELKNVFFSVNTAILEQPSFKELDLLIAFLRIDTTTKIEIIGYTDNSGTEMNNKKLSVARAEAVKAYLVSKDINTQRLICKGYGSSNPRVNNNTEEGRKCNRRVEIKPLEVGK
jgi:OOP family OmpA-OmpF porin